jgi:hypothetical protein
MDFASPNQSEQEKAIAILEVSVDEATSSTTRRRLQD